MSDIAKNIKKLRQKEGLTQEELAEKLFVTRQAVSNWETGKNQPDLDTLKALAEVLEADVRELLYGPTPDKNRRKRVIAAIVLCALAAISWIAFALIYDEAMLRRHTFDVRLSYVVVLVVRPIAFFLTGAAVSALISIWNPLHPTKRWMRWGMLFLVGGFLLTYLLGGVLMFYIPKVNCYWLLWVGYHPWTFLIPGALLFCGLGRKAG